MPSYRGMERVDITIRETVDDEAVRVQHCVHTIVNKFEVEKVAIEKILRSLQPCIDITYRSVRHDGRFPIHAASTIGCLSTIDRARIDNFFAFCDGGLVESRIVSDIRDLVDMKEFSELLALHEKGSVDLYEKDIGRAFINPYSSSQDSEMVQLSAQFAGIVLSRDARPFDMIFECSDRMPITVTITGEEVYTAFEEKCRNTVKRMQVIRELYERTVRPAVRIQSTMLSGHKIWMRQQDGSFLTLYLVRTVVTKRSRAVSKLTVVAVDCRVRMPDVAGFVVPTNECAVCMDALEGDMLYWKCDSCNNILHLTCAESWMKQGNATCPFCRVSM